ncbi:Protein of unknown function DUF2800 [uncultured Caudovirales phage]|uniref:DUF2800 domain-containing protein n=1 Tax=uncultured Caudovirales phage TaxID=2100421 RepID=A0A6J5T8V6_9CAUD|nr:Protein of unknown function DUF2800 [uncultured Caudovirales phage]
MSTHAVLSPSSAVRWMNCPGSVTLSEGLGDKSSSAASEGTMMHAFSALCLEDDIDAKYYVGITDDETGLTLTEAQAVDVQTYVDHVRDIVRATGGTLLVEQRLPIGWMTNEEGAHGTADAVVVTPNELIVVDAKFGRGIEVDAEENPQLLMYAAAAYDEHKIAYDFKTIRLVISQPRLGAAPEWSLTVEQLVNFISEVIYAADKTREDTEVYVPSSKACQWCRAKAICPAIKTQVLDAFDEVQPETATEDGLAKVMSMAGMIEAWIKSIRAEVERRLLAGEPVTGYKLVQGKRGNRQWANPEDAESTLKAMRVKHDQMYDYKLTSPTSIEKLVKAKAIGPRQWAKIQDLITQSEGQPSVAPESDKRSALVPSADVSDFDDVTTTP